MVRLRRRSNDRGASLRKVLGGVELPAIPELVAAAIEQVSSPDAELREVAETIRLDPGVSARLLTVVNSAAYAPRNPIVDVRQAVTMLGKNRLESMLISLAVSGAVATTRVPGFDMFAFWRLAAWRASAAAALSRQVDRSRSSVNFSASLLQDVAVPILVANEPRYGAVLAAWMAGDGDLEDLENRAFGWTHTAVTGWLFEEWGFPPALHSAVTEVGRPEDGPVAYPVVRVMTSLGARQPGGVVIEETARRIVSVFGVPYDEAASLLKAARSDGADLARYLT